MVAMLDRKLLRDLWHLRGQVAAMGVVVACGVAVVMATRTSYRSLLDSRAAYYTEYRFADVFAHLKRAPESLAERLAAIPGVGQLETRILVEVTLDVPGLAEPATGRLISVPDGRQPGINRVHLRRGAWPEPGRRDQVIVSEAFAIANRLEIGDAIGAVINGRWQQLRIAGVGLSPEYVYEIGGGNMFPDNRRFGVVWLSREALAPAFDMEGAFNDLSLTLSPDGNEDVVIDQLDRLLLPYGGLGAYGRSEQISARFLSDEIAQTQVSGTIIPAIFLSVAAFLLHIVLARFIGNERQQIAVLKAFGYTDWAIGWHYIKLALTALLLGAVGGIALGLWFAQRLNVLYADYYRFPSFLFRVDGTAVAIAFLVTLVAAIAGAAGAVRRSVRLTPAAAMQPDSPGQFRAGALERLGLQRLFATPARIIIRNLERRPLKAVLSALGIAFAAAILVVGTFLFDSMRYMAVVQFRHVQREDLSVVFTGPRSAGVRYELARFPGVLRVEPFRSSPVRISSGHRNRRIELLGLEPAGELRRIMGSDLVPVSIPPGGIVLTSKLAQVLQVKAGDTVSIQVLEGKRQLREVPVAALVDEMLGINGYMDQSALNRMLEEGNTLTGSLLRVDPALRPELLARLKRIPAIAGVTSREAAMAGFQDTLDESMGLVTSILITFAAALAVAMVYNTARIALAERARELASLRVLGFTRGEISLMLLGEQALLTAVGIAAGLALGYGFAAWLTSKYQWELFRIPLIVSARTYAYAAAVIVGAALFSGLLVRRRLNRLDLVAVLKTKE